MTDYIENVSTCILFAVPRVFVLIAASLFIGKKKAETGHPSSLFTPPPPHSSPQFHRKSQTSFSQLSLLLLHLLHLYVHCR